MGRMQRNKGATYEREIVHTINAKFDEPYKAKRRLGQAREGGHDIEWSAPFIIEAKRRARQLPAAGWLEQARIALMEEELFDEATPPKTPVVVTRGDSGESLAVLSLDDFLDMVYDILKLQGA
jgi:hypothetical protein